MDYLEGIEFFQKIKELSIEEQIENHAWEIWVGHINNPFVEKKVPWDKFIGEIKEPKEKSNTLSKEEIISQCEAIKERHMAKKKKANVIS